MNKEELIKKFFEKLLNYAESAEQFMAGNAPRYVEELLTYGAIEAITWGSTYAALSLLCVVISAIMFRIMLKEQEPAVLMGVLFAGSLFVLGCVATLEYSLDYAKIKNAPRVYILEQIRK